MSLTLSGRSLADIARSKDPLANPYQSLQLLSLVRPDFEYFWLMDYKTRYTGHHYNFFHKIAAWSKAQSRTLSWEKAALVYVPEVHRSWKNFTIVAARARDIDARAGLLSTAGIEPVGSGRPFGIGRYRHWGEGEESDLITLGSIFHPPQADFGNNSVMGNYSDGDDTPYRVMTFPNMTRTSKRLLRAMHHGQITAGTWMHPAMYPVSTALHHRLKVSTFPLPVFTDVSVTPAAMERKLNVQRGKDAFHHPMTYHNVWQRLTFAVPVSEESGFADELYKQWVGFDETGTKAMCLPGLLLHPIRNV